MKDEKLKIEHTSLDPTRDSDAAFALAELQEVLACHGGILNKQINDNVTLAGFKQDSHGEA
jgi:hypothetical protein